MKPSINLFMVLHFASVTMNLLSAQELHIYYNLHNDDVRYEKEGAVLTEPNIKQGDEVVLHLIEFNNYIYRVELEINQEQVIERSAIATDGSLMASMIPGLPMPSLSGFSGLNNSGDSTGGGNVGLLNIPLLKLNDNPITLSSLFGGSRGSEQVLQQLANYTSEISTMLIEMEGISAQIKEMRKTALVSKMAMEYVDVLKTHPNLKPTFVKNMCTEYYEAIFRTKPNGPMPLGDVLNLQDDAMKYSDLLTDLQAHKLTLSKKVGLLDALAKQFKGMELDDANYHRYSASLSDFLTKSKALNQQMEGALSDSLVLGKYPSPIELTNLQLKLVEIIDNDFTHHTRFQVTGDRLAINIKMVKKDKQINDESEIVKSRWLRYEAKGGLKITGSVGLNFSQYFDPSQSYSANNGIIVGEDDGVFTPTVTSFIHFYSYSGKRTSLGGSFGIGFPLAGAGDTQALQFFVGPSLIFGSSQRIILNFGLTGGKVTRLGRGFKIGDEFDVTIGDIPTKSPYELGLYIGASFNLAGN